MSRVKGKGRAGKKLAAKRAPVRDLDPAARAARRVKGGTQCQNNLLPSLTLKDPTLQSPLLQTKPL